MKLALDRLPSTLRTLADLIGLPATLRLVMEWGGTTYWPARTGDQAAHQAEILGEEAAARLADHFREPIYIPMAEAAMRAVEHDAIRQEGDELERQGVSARQAVAQLARKYRHSDSYIWRLRKRSDVGGKVVDVRQGDLFGS